MSVTFWAAVSVSSLCVVGLVVCVWLAYRSLTRVTEVALEAIKSQERTTKVALDRLLALIDTQAFAVVRQAEAPPRKPRSVRTFKLT